MTSDILIVDDNAAIREVLADILASGGYASRGAYDGDDAIKAVEKTPPELILLDVKMPGMDGFEVCRYLKANPATTDIPILFITAQKDIDDVTHGFSVGGADYIIKPFEVKEVLARIQYQLTIRQHHRQMIQQSNTLNEMRHQFVNGAAHDLRNPLQAIKGYTHLLEAQAQDPIAVRSHAQQIRLEILYMQQLITEMLELAQIQTGIELLLSETSCKDFMASCVRNKAVIASEKQIEFVYLPPLEDAIINIDSRRMTRVMDNLISNAIKYTLNEGCVTVSWHVQTTESRVVIQIADTGLGIPEDEIPHLFEPFYRVKSNSHMKVEGTGLGLAIVKTIIDQHHGEIRVMSEPEKGTNFAVSLPII